MDLAAYIVEILQHLLNVLQIVSTLPSQRNQLHLPLMQSILVFMSEKGTFDKKGKITATAVHIGGAL